ncbi:MAG: hypothetical protein BroJett040_02700 [Oligoflexia bacterium]|nr:MAG: hypothetical protein BroJett040_02700 [Oligoflexia bacterium]
MSNLRKGFNQSTYKSLQYAYRPHFKSLFVFLTLGFLGRATLLANTNLIGFWADSFCKPDLSIQCHPTPFFFQGFDNWDYLLVLVGLVLIGFLLTWIFRVGFSIVSARAVSRLYDETTLRTSRFPMSFFDHTPAGRIITRFSSDYGSVFRFFGGPLAEFISIVFDIICMTILIGIASPYYLPLIFAVGTLSFIVYKFNQKNLREARRELSASRSPSIAHFAETAQGASTIRSFSRQESFTSRFNQLDLHYLNQKIKTVFRIMLFSFQMNTMTAFLLLATSWLGYYLLQKSLVSVGSVGVALGFIVLSSNTVQMFFEWLAQSDEALVGAERLDQYMQKEIEPGARLPAVRQFQTSHWVYQKSDETSDQKITNRAASVTFKDVWFRYGDQLPFVLKGLCFHVPAGERWGIVGRTGSGKSSLIQALFYLYPIHSGQILVNGQQPQLNPDSTGIDLQQYRKALSFISQEPVLFTGTLASNLDIEEHLSAEILCSVLKQVGLTEWATPDGLQMVIEEKGRNLSLGEKQLICMARCLLQNTPVVIMDEATSSVDPRSEEIMVKATNDFFDGRTQIIIAHRLSTLKKCHKILWLQDGTIRMIGTPSEVLPIFEKTSLASEMDI